MAVHADQGWSLLCNHVVIFDDTGQLLPDGKIIEPRRRSFAGLTMQGAV